MKVKTRDFGEVDISKDEVINFPQGIPGFVERKKYVLLTLPGDSPFFVLQSIEDSNLAFYVMDPWKLITDYEFELPQSTIKMLEIDKKEDVLVMVICSANEKMDDMTVNLAAPLVINHRQKKGKQVILEDSNYPLKHPVFQKKKQQGVE